MLPRNRPWTMLFGPMLALLAAAPAPGQMFAQSPPEKVPVNHAGRLIAARSPERDRIWAHAVDHGNWEVYRAPAGTKLSFLTSSDLLATIATGEKLTEVAAFNVRTRQWRTQALREPATGELSPHISSNLAAYVVGRRVYAFSAEADRWDVLELSEGTRPVVLTGASAISAQGGDLVSIFSARTGKWDTIDVTK